MHHARRAGAGRDRRARARHPRDRDRVRGELRPHHAGRAARCSRASAPDIAALGGGRGKGVLVVDDLVDTGKTAKLVRDILPEAHFAAVYAKPHGPAAGRHLHHRSVAGHLDLLPLGHRARVPAADPGGRAVGLTSPVRDGRVRAIIGHEFANERRRRMDAVTPKSKRAVPRRAPRQDGMAEDALSRLRDQDAAVRCRQRPRHRADAFCAGRRAARPRARAGSSRPT